MRVDKNKLFLFFSIKGNLRWIIVTHIMHIYGNIERIQEYIQYLEKMYVINRKKMVKLQEAWHSCLEKCHAWKNYHIYS